jgi:hypothetical protein
VDFVVVGFGVGALGLLLGVVCLAWGARRYDQATRPAPPATPSRDLHGAIALRDAGQVFLSAGGAILLATIGALVTALDDATGALVVTTTITVAALGILLWAFLHRARIPFLMPRPRPRPAAARAERHPAWSMAAMPMFAAVAKPAHRDPDQALAAGSDSDPDAVPTTEAVDAPPDGPDEELPAAVESTMPEGTMAAEEPHNRGDADAAASNGKEPVVDGALPDSEAVGVPVAAPDEPGAQLQPTPDDDEDTS